MDYTSDISTTTTTSIYNANDISNNSTIQAGIQSNRSINEHISEPTQSYQSSIFTAMEPQEPYPSDTRLALTQVLTSFQGANSILLGSNSSPSIDSISTFTDHSRSAAAPAHMLAPPEATSLGTDESLDMSNDNLSAFTRAALPRRRYATRDYSTGSISSDDWLHHPDVVAFNTQDTTQGTSSSADVY
ncbi:hypothetical protein BGZ97_008907 [Linnemannia gamsii]|uniref:Uncharacterized protein n=1 Tax=Linnemannia gamsii TaxID=64522 RepID=A0A9P6UEH0_9FUNG|nr:hypothetical protein BGZ97_008907 [Linnemannia gamsii]